VSRLPTRIPHVSCYRCKGTGSVPMPAHLFAVLLEVRAAGRGITASEVAKQLYTLTGLGKTAFNNRLEDLRALGLVNRYRDGKTWVYHLPRIVSRLGLSRSGHRDTQPKGET
jgi:DNA-binding transcriptional ArsR family regulator